MYKQLPTAAVALAWLLACLTQVGAAPAASKPRGPSHTAQAHAELARLAAAYKSAKSLTYASTVTIITPTNQGLLGQQFEIQGYIQKPNRIRVQMYDNTGKLIGLIVSNGAEIYAYDPAGNRYLKSQVESSGSSALFEPFSVAGPLLGDVVSQAMLTAGMFASSHPYDLSVRRLPGGVHLDEAPAVMDGKPVIHISERASSQGRSITFHLYVDRATGLPRRIAQDVEENGIGFEPMREDFSAITILSGPLEAANFSWSPPGGALHLTQPSAADEGKPALAAGTSAPDFSVETVGGKFIHLADYKGKVVVVDFWATWCGPCQDEFPHTDKIARSYASKGVVFLPICSWDAKSAFLKWTKQHKGMSMRFYFDPAAEDQPSSIANSLYGVQGIPTQYVIGKDGKVVTGFVGYNGGTDPDEKALEKALKKALAAS